MPTLAQSLLHHDLGHLRILAEHWGFELAAPDVRSGLPELSAKILAAGLVAEIHAALPAEARAALQALQRNQGRFPWAQFTRQFGKVREIGPGRRDRERPDRSPISPAEILWYRGLIARAFFDSPAGSQEFAYIPDDLLPLLPADPGRQAQTGTAAGQPIPGRAATPGERAQPLPANDRLLDHVCTLLAAHRLGSDPGGYLPAEIQPFAQSLLSSAGLLAAPGLPDPEAVRTHLEAPRGESLRQLAQAWLHSPSHNDLLHIPDLQAEGEWQNDPLAARQFIIKHVIALPPNTWWSLSAFVADIRRDHPDFQRPAGDYDSWFLRDVRSGEFLRGYEHWEAVDGALIRYLICGPLHWLGVLDLATPAEDIVSAGASAFRLARGAAGLIGSAAPPEFPKENAALHVRSDGRISLGLLTPRVVRYQIARFCHWEEATPHEYRYRLTPWGLERALRQGLQIKHLQTLLARHARQVPPNIVQALSRWEGRGTEARFETVLVLRMGTPELLQSLRASRAARFLGDPLGPAAVIVKPGAAEKVLEILTEMGYLGEILEAG
jgi:hypothetical protein